jgi:beta-galactosidase
LAEFSEILANIFNYRGSVNFYMFHGGTNFGFMAGANHIVANNIQVVITKSSYKI